MNSAERIKRYRLKQKEQGRLKREMYLTDSEFLAIKSKLVELREPSFTTIITDVKALEIRND